MDGLEGQPAGAGPGDEVHDGLQDAVAGADGASGGGALLDSLPGLVRRVRRRLGMSQRALAAALGVSQSRVARWETGRTSPSVADLADVLALGGVTLVAVDEAGEEVRPMSPAVVRDRAHRLYPAHCDPRGRGWWAPPGSSTTVEGAWQWQRSRELGVPRITYERGVWRAMLRLAHGTPQDHPTLAEVVDELRAFESGQPRAS
ncbi:helix-turn-helix domain-containing protein [Nocardioides sediminis]|uniref:helix-turn-helix domain-containing protein n=1 Tax=Nocardioides sediminis TaxID=433648 RepID=UPI000D302DE6|nr:helix-turn-helix transcriptional regulator [Nocardioides sediminis]